MVQSKKNAIPVDIQKEGAFECRRECKTGGKKSVTKKAAGHI